MTFQNPELLAKLVSLPTTRRRRRRRHRRFQHKSDAFYHCIEGRCN